ncbi:MAG: hypothetical protein Q7T03_09840, partial [Deltaproteobacteria bacterium]|nr:hypothetical protein [Deltaproteobacteria bacterium]
GGEADLRGFVQGRFTGRGSVFLNLEERIVIKRWSIMDVKTDVSIDPFFCVGQVFDDWDQMAFGSLQPVGGIGFRAKAHPSIVGRVDVGYGKEGIEVYTGLDYPF